MFVFVLESLRMTASNKFPVHKFCCFIARGTDFQPDVVSNVLDIVVSSQRLSFLNKGCFTMED